VSGPGSEDARRPEGRPWSIARALQLAFWAALFWTGLGVFFASQLYLGGLPWSIALSLSISPIPVRRTGRGGRTMTAEKTSHRTLRRRDDPGSHCLKPATHR